MQRRKIGILCLQEIRWKGQGARELGEGTNYCTVVAVVWSGGNSGSGDEREGCGCDETQ